MAEQEQQPGTGGEGTPPEPKETPKPAGTAGGGDTYEELRAAIEKERGDRQRFEKEAKANRDAAKRLEELENASKTELDKLRDGESKATKRAEAAELRAERLDVAIAKGLPASLAKRLTGETREEMEADADELLETLGSAKPASKPRGSSGVKEATGGGEPGEPALEMDPRKLAQGISRY